MNSNQSSIDTNQVTTLVEKLRNKLQNFDVKNLHGEVIAKVQDLKLDENQQLNLVVLKTNSPNSDLFLLTSKFIEKVDSLNKGVIVNIDLNEMENLPKYINQEISNPEPVIDESIDADLTTIQTPAYELRDEDNNEIISESAINESIETDLTTIQTPAYELTEIQQKPPMAFNPPDVLEAEIIRLLQERLIIDRSKYKIGEVIIRKVTETRMVQVPIRREKLIIEQVGAETKQLAEINLGEDEFSSVEFIESQISEINGQKNNYKLAEIGNINGELSVKGEFNSPKIVSLLLNAIALERNHGCKKVRLEIVVENQERQQTYQEWFNRCSEDGKINS